MTEIDVEVEGDWYVMGNGYIMNCKGEYLHRKIYEKVHGYCPPMLDHKDGNPLNCRIGNLRPCTQSQNNMNARPKSDSKWSEYKGVRFKCDKPRTKPWEARIRLNGESSTLGHFSTELEAAKAYDSAAERLFGEFARLNFPKDEK